MLNFSGWSCSYKNGSLLAKFQPGALNSFVLICGCLLFFKSTWFTATPNPPYGQIFLTKENMKLVDKFKRVSFVVTFRVSGKQL